MKSLASMLNYLSCGVHIHSGVNQFCACLSARIKITQVFHLQLSLRALFGRAGASPPIRELVDSLRRDGADTPIVHVHTKAF